MARKNSADMAFFLVGGYSVLGTLTQVTDSIEATLEQTQVLGDTWKSEQYTGVRMGEITQEGFYDDDAGSVHDMLSTGPGVSRVLAFGDGGTATGAPVTVWEGAMQVNYERVLTVGALHKARASYQNNGTIERHKLIRTYKANTATGATTGTPLDGAASSTGGAGVLEYNASQGEANVRMLHSSDNVTYATLFTFTKTASGFGAERLTTTGVIERYTAYDVSTATATGAITALNSMMSLYRGALTS